MLSLACCAPVNERMIVTYHLLKEKRVYMLISHAMYRYSEAVGLLYTSNTLHVCQTRTIVGMQKSMQPHRLRMIRFLHIDVPLHDQWKNGRVVGCEESWPRDILTFGEPVWPVIAEIKGLLNLKVTLNCQTPPEIDQETLVHILQPIMTIIKSRVLCLK